MKKNAYRYTSFARTRSKELRKNMTPSERHLWFDFLRNHKPRFLRQRAIGPYIVDFICYEANLIVELDGEIHDGDTEQKHDHERDNNLRHRGFRTIRIRSREVFENFEGVCAGIEKAVKDRSIEGWMT